MHELIASYLFQNQSCPLPGLGKLSIVTSKAQSNFGDNVVNAPKQSVQFSADDTDSSDLIAYLSSKTNTDPHASGMALNEFCRRIKDDTTSHSSANLDGVGNFVIDNNGELGFVPLEIPQVFVQSVPVVSVVRADAEHNILVGDKETTNIQMAEYYSEEPETKSRWWIWAIVLTVVGIGLLLLYLFDADRSDSFGNAVKILDLT